MSVAPALNKIADELDRFAAEADAPDGSPIDPFDIRHSARRVRAQAEMLSMQLENDNA